MPDTVSTSIPQSSQVAARAADQPVEAKAPGRGDASLPAPGADGRGNPKSPSRLGAALPRWRIGAWAVFLFLLSVVMVALFYPPAWHVAVRTWLGWQAERRGLRLEIEAMAGSPLDVTVLHHVRLRPLGAGPGDAGGATATDVEVQRVEFVLSPSLPWLHRPKSSWLDNLVLEGVRGHFALDALRSRRAAGDSGGGSGSPADWPRARGRRFFSSLTAHLTPLNFEFNVPRDADLTLHRSAASVRLRGLRLSGYKDAPGVLLVREVEARAPGGLDSVYHNWHASTQWTGTRLTVNRLALAPGIELLGATLDGSQLRRKLLNGDLTVRALGGTLRGQVKARLPGTRGPDAGRWQLEAAGSLESVAVRPLTELLGLAGPTGGVVRAGVFSFSGDPSDLPAAAASLRVEITGFQWGERRWQRLLLAATVLHRRITVHELDLVQRRNRVVLNGEGPLPDRNAAGKPLPGPDSTVRFGLPPWLENFSCNLDARIDDLNDFTLLLGPGFGLPELAGRMNAQGTLTGRERTLDGYLKIEAGPLRVRGGPLDRLRATMTFRGDELQIASLEAARADDSLSGKATFELAGSGRYTAEGKVNVRDLAPYQPAFAAYGFPEPPTGALNLEWSGDGSPGAHSGAFRGRLNGFFSRAGRVVLPRRIDLEADGTYSPDSVSFRQLSLRDLGDATAAAPAGKRPASPPPAPAAALRFEGVALPLSPTAGARAGNSGLFRAEGTFSGRVLWTEFPLDLLPAVFPETLREAGGRMSGWLDLGGTPGAPHLNGQLTLRKGRLRWTQQRVATWLDADNTQADVRFDGPADTLLLDKLSTDRPGGGAVSVSGQVNWSETATAPVFNLALGAKNLDLLNNGTMRARADADLTVVGPVDVARIAGTVQLHDAHFYRQFWLEPVADEPRLSLVPLPGNPADAGADPLLARLLPLASLRHGPLATGELDLALSVDAPIPLEVANATRGTLKPELYLTGTGDRPHLVGKLAFQPLKASASAGTGPLPKFGQLLPVEDGVIYFDPAGLAASTVLLRDLAQPAPGNAPNIARSRSAGASVFAPLERIPLRVWGGDDQLALPWDFNTPPATPGPGGLTLESNAAQPVFSENVLPGYRVQFFRLVLY